MSSRNKDLPELPDPDGRPEVDSLWQHKKGGIYRVLNIGIETETLHWVVIYRAEPFQEGESLHIWVRPLEMFMDGRFTAVTDIPSR